VEWSAVGALPASLESEIRIADRGVRMRHDVMKKDAFHVAKADSATVDGITRADSCKRIVRCGAVRGF
jgi:hypothetical protein